MHDCGRSWRNFGLGLLVSVLVTACATAPGVDVVRSPEAEFGRFHTFTFQKPLGTDRQEGTGTILSQTLKRATRAELEARGYRYEDGEADLRINFFVETQEVVDRARRRPGVGISYGVFHRHVGVWTGYETGEPVVYQRGTLHVDVIDTEQDQLVWEGIARSREPEGEFAFEPERVQRSIKGIFARFPRRRADEGF